jgi:electron transport complex protein RnfC
MGGAAFPSYVKLAPPPGKPVDTLVVNAAECEPFLTVDHRLMLERAPEVAQGIRIIQKLLGVQNVVIGIEDNKFDAFKAMEAELKGHAKLVLVPTKYPQGAEKMLIKTLLGREVPPGKLPLDVGVVVQNVSTALRSSKP